MKKILCIKCGANCKLKEFEVSDTCQVDIEEIEKEQKIVLDAIKPFIEQMLFHFQYPNFEITINPGKEDK